MDSSAWKILLVITKIAKIFKKDSIEEYTSHDWRNNSIFSNYEYKTKIL